MPNPAPPDREDDPCDLIRKAMCGVGCSIQQLADQAQISPSTIESCLRDAPRLPEDIPRSKLIRLTNALDLNLDALLELPDYQPMVFPPDGLTQIVTPFHHAGANAYLINRGQEAILFDTGTDARPILQHLAHHAWQLRSVYITHNHHDHVAGLPAFDHVPIITADQLEHQQSITALPGITLTALETDGHYTPSKAYHLSGLSSPLCICGDILFAGSMGKTANPNLFRQSIDNARKHLMTLAPETILCPGHGPLTTIAREARHNPFLVPSLPDEK